MFGRELRHPRNIDLEDVEIDQHTRRVELCDGLPRSDHQNVFTGLITISTSTSVLRGIAYSSYAYADLDYTASRT